ncbi:MAG: (2Fe-2S)-binding protein [Planctomycetaceae bacterium]|nr:(2Fe-2S)-binding protein [Planctomycetaceae bacterium]
MLHRPPIPDPSSSIPSSDETLCRCLGISVGEVRAATDFAGCRTLCQIKETTGAGTGCMSCHRRIHKLLDEQAEARRQSPLASPT